MIRIKCPKCAKPLGVPETQAGNAATCPGCGQKFRIPATAGKQADDDSPATRAPAKTAPARQQPAATDQAHQGYAALPPSKPSESSRRVQRQEDEEERDRDEGTPRPKKRKKKKKKEKQPTGLSGAHIVMIAVGVVVVLAATGILFMIQRGAFTKAKPDPGPVLAELKQIGAQIEYDQNSPDHPVIGVGLTGREFKPSLLGRLVAFPQLRKLNLSSTLTSDINLDHLEDVTSLQSLNLSHTKVTGGGMQFLKKMVNLEELHLNQTLVHDPGLRELTGLKKLKKIYLDGTLASGLELQDAIPGLEVIK